jgi:enoyl-CoA hydratase/carnithine racemase
MEEWVSICQGLVSLMRKSHKPLLTLIRGLATGGGLEMTLH